MADLFEVPDSFKNLVDQVLNSELIRNKPNGAFEVHIGYHEVEVNDPSDYTDSLICPYVHIKSADFD